VRRLATLLLNGVAVRSGEIFPSGWYKGERQYYTATDDMLAGAIHWNWRHRHFSVETCHVIDHRRTRQKIAVPAGWQYSRSAQLSGLNVERQGTTRVSRMTSEALQCLFGDFNAEYFSGRIPHYKVHLIGEITKLGEAGSISFRNRFMRISGHLADAEIAGTLVHEMVHASVKGGHTRKWFEEMQRVRSEGAPISALDTALLAIGPLKTLSRARLVRLAQEALREEPHMTEWKIARWIVQRYDYANSPTAFFRKYRWAWSVLSTCRLDDLMHHPSGEA
jgi:hypothetical protein